MSSAVDVASLNASALKDHLEMSLKTADVMFSSVRFRIQMFGEENASRPYNDTSALKVPAEEGSCFHGYERITGNVENASVANAYRYRFKSLSRSMQQRIVYYV